MKNDRRLVIIRRDPRSDNLLHLCRESVVILILQATSVPSRALRKVAVLFFSPGSILNVPRLAPPLGNQSD